MDTASLKKFDLFKDVDESKLSKIAPFTMLVEFPAGKTIIQEGGFSNDFYAIDRERPRSRGRARRSPISDPATSSASRACSSGRSAQRRSSRPPRSGP